MPDDSMIPQETLLPQHAALLRASAISEEVAAARRYRSVTTKAELRRFGFSDRQARTPALLLPVWSVRGEIATYQIRPDLPRLDRARARPIKYETPTGSGMVLDVPPAVRAVLGDPAVPLLLTEGVRKADAAVSARLACLALLGVWNWRGSNADGGKTALADWEAVALNGRRVYLVFDSDVMTNPKVHAALARLKAFLEARGADVNVVYLPPQENGGKVGLDDYLAAGHTPQDLLALARPDLLRPEGEEGDDPGAAYRETPGGLVWRQSTRDGEIERPLCNFTARIVADVLTDDGAETTREFAVEARRNGRAVRFVLPAARFAAMNWPTEHLGASAVVYPGFGLREHARAAVQLLSGEVPEDTIFLHTGWRRIEDRWCYLHAAGAIGPEGAVPGVLTRPAGLDRYVLPDPPDPEATRDAVRRSLAFLNVARPEQSWPLLAGVYTAPLASLVSCDFGVWVAGPTGARKSTAAALALCHYGRFDRNHLPECFESTGNALADKAFAAKDALLVVDDFAPRPDAKGAAAQDAAGYRLLRAVGDAHARGRLRSDSTRQADKPPRGLVLATAELPPPGGQSTAARTFVVDWQPAGVDLAALTRAQDEDAPLYPLALAAYARWLAGEYDALRETLPGALAALRTDANRCPGIGHGRLAETAAKLLLGALVWLRFGLAAGALTEEEALAHAEDAAAALLTCARRTGTEQAERKPTAMFWEYLRAMLAQGAVYLPRQDGTPPAQPALLGYRARSYRNHDGEEVLTHDVAPNAEKIGWVDEDADEAFLLPAAVFRAVVRYAHAADVRLPVTQRALAEHLERDGYLLRTAPGRKDVQFRAEGRGGLRGWCVRADVLTGDLSSPASGYTGYTGYTPTETQEPCGFSRALLVASLSASGYTSGYAGAPVATPVAAPPEDWLQDAAPEPAPYVASGPAVAGVAGVAGSPAGEGDGVKTRARVEVLL